MKRFAILISLLFSVFVSYSQANKQQGLAALYTVSTPATSGGEGDFIVSGFMNDPLGIYTVDSVEVGDIVWDASGHRFVIEEINSRSGNTISLDLTALTEDVPEFDTGVGCIQNETGMLPIAIIGGLSDIVRQSIDNHRRIVSRYDELQYPYMLAGNILMLTQSLTGIDFDTIPIIEELLAKIDTVNMTDLAGIRDTMNNILDTISNKPTIGTFLQNKFPFASGSKSMTTTLGYLGRETGRVFVDSLAAFRLPSWTTAGRIVSPKNGDEAYNTTLHLPDVYINGAWRNGVVSNGVLPVNNLMFADATGQAITNSALTYDVTGTYLRLGTGNAPGSAAMHINVGSSPNKDFGLTFTCSSSGKDFIYSNTGYLNLAGIRVRGASNQFDLRTGFSEPYFIIGYSTRKHLWFDPNLNTPRTELSQNAQLVMFRNVENKAVMTLRGHTTQTTPYLMFVSGDSTTIQKMFLESNRIRFDSIRTLTLYDKDGDRGADRQIMKMTTSGINWEDEVTNNSKTITQTAHGFTAPEAVFWNEINYKSTDGVTGDTIRCSGVVVEVINSNQFKLQSTGFYDDDFSLPEGMYYANSSGGLSLTPDPDATIPVMQVENGYTIVNPIVEDEKQALAGEIMTLETSTGSRGFDVGETLTMHYDSLIGKSYAGLFAPTDTIVMTGANYYTVGDWNTGELATSDWTKRDTALVYTGTNNVVFKVSADVCYRIWPDNIATDDTYEIRLITGTGASTMSRRYKEVPEDGFEDCVTMTAFYTGNNSGSNALIRVSVGNMPGEIKFMGGSLVVERL